MGFRGYAGYFKLPEAKAAFDSLGWKEIALEAWPITKAMWNVWRRTKAMRKPWPWKPGDAALARPLADLREEWGIEVITGPA